ncbi:MAG: glycosyltransferase [Acidobacteria bacterium]|nr:glycosyltransferase [Acidobacteriota bacterium]
MKIAFVLECFPRVSETFILDQVTGFLDLGHEVVLLSLWTPDTGVFLHADISHYQLLDKTEYINYHPGAFRGRIKRLLYFAQNFPGTFYRWARRPPTKKVPRVPLHFLFGKQIQKVYPLVRHQVDLVYCHFGTTAREFSFLRDRLKKPFVAAFWGYDVDLLPQGRPGVYKEVFEKFDLFCTSSHYLAKKLVALGCPQERLMLQRVGLKTDQLKNILPTRGAQPLRFLSVGRLVEEKGYSFSIQAVSKLRCDYEYCIIGDGPARERLTRLIGELGLAQRVKLLGYKMRHEVFQFMAGSDIYLCPSLRESFGVANLEASFFQLPIIASRIGGIPEVVQDGKTGLLVPPGDVEALTTALEHLIAYREVRLRMGEAGRKMVEAQFDQRSLMRHLEQQFRRLVARHKQSYG